MARPGSSRGADYMRGFLWGVQGEEVVMRNLNAELEKIKARSEKGLTLAAAFILQQTEKVPPLTPVDTGNLRASRFITSASTLHTGVMKNEGTGRFKGKNASKMYSNHGLVTGEAKMMVASKNTNSKKHVMLGYTANYGGFVHEMIGANFKRPGAGPKWFEAAVKRNIPKIVQIVKDNAQIKG